MDIEIGTWHGDGSAGTYAPTVDHALVDDPRFPALAAATTTGCDFSAATVLVTGASDPASIGFAIARNFCRGGGSVVITGTRELTRIDHAAAECVAEAGAGRCRAARVDQGDTEAIDALFAACKAEGLAFSHLYPFAAINHPALFVGIKPADYARVFAVNTFGVYHLAVRHARATPRGVPSYVVVPLSPNDGRLQGSGLYPASKQALRPLVIQGQAEYGDRRGITYTGIDIAWTRSALMAKLDAGVAAARDAGLKVFEISDTADCCTLLGTPAAAALKGTVLDAGGGFASVAPTDMAAVLKALG